MRSQSDVATAPPWPEKHANRHSECGECGECGQLLQLDRDRVGDVTRYNRINQTEFCFTEGIQSCIYHCCRAATIPITDRCGISENHLGPRCKNSTEWPIAEIDPRPVE